MPQRADTATVSMRYLIQRSVPALPGSIATSKIFFTVTGAIEIAAPCRMKKILRCGVQASKSGNRPTDPRAQIRWVSVRPEGRESAFGEDLPDQMRSEA